MFRTSYFPFVAPWANQNTCQPVLPGIIVNSEERLLQLLKFMDFAW